MKIKYNENLGISGTKIKFHLLLPNSYYPYNWPGSGETKGTSKKTQNRGLTEVRGSIVDPRSWDLNQITRFPNEIPARWSSCLSKGSIETFLDFYSIPRIFGVVEKYFRHSGRNLARENRCCNREIPRKRSVCTKQKRPRRKRQRAMGANMADRDRGLDGIRSRNWNAKPPPLVAARAFPLRYFITPTRRSGMREFCQDIPRLRPGYSQLVTGNAAIPDGPAKIQDQSGPIQISDSDVLSWQFLATKGLLPNFSIADINIPGLLLSMLAEESLEIKFRFESCDFCESRSDLSRSDISVIWVFCEIFDKLRINLIY